MDDKLFLRNVDVEEYIKLFTKFSHKMDVEEKRFFYLKEILIKKLI